MPCPSALRTIALRLAAFSLAILPVGVLTPARAQSPAGQIANTVPGEEHCVVNVAADDVLNLRASPGVESRILAGLAYATCGVMVRDACHGAWCPVEAGHHAGWVHARFIAAVSPARYCIDGVFGDVDEPLRAFPALHSRVLTHLERHGCGIAFLPYETRGWRKIRAGGREGWVPRVNLTGQ